MPQDCSPAQPILTPVPIRSFLYVVCLLALLSACASTPKPGQSARLGSGPIGLNLPEDDEIRQTLYRQHQDWIGTPYRFGGLNKNGVDCSGLVYRTFNEEFGQPLPRTTKSQAKAGKPVALADLRAGDLLFFRTGRSTRHVGIYIEDTRFLHASTSRGVIILDLRNPYWASHYWQARRIRTLR